VANLNNVIIKLYDIVWLYYLLSAIVCKKCGYDEGRIGGVAWIC